MEDQLRASEGWVRCGHCRQIFDALERLFQLEESAPPAGPTPHSSALNPSAPSSALSRHGSDLIEPDVAWAETRPAMLGEEHLLVPSGSEVPAPAPPATSEVSLAEALGEVEPSSGTVGGGSFVVDTGLPQASDLAGAELTPTPGPQPDEPAAALTFVSPQPPELIAEADLGDPGPNTQPQSLAFVDTAAGDEVMGVGAVDPSAPEEHADSSTLFLIEDVGTDKEVEAARAKELIQELEPSSVIQQRQAQRSAPDDEDVSTPSGSSRPTGAGELSSSRSGGRSSSGRRRSSSSHRGSSAPVVSADESLIPAFVRRADSKARWQRPWVRVSLAIIAIGSALALSTQAAIQWHDLIGARSPTLRPLVQDLCRKTTGCVLEPPKLIDAVVVESSALTRPSEQIGYRLNVLIRNRLDHEIAPPHLELTLTDISGAVLVRRVLTPADFGVTRNTLESQSESGWQLDFHYDTPAISGYTVRAFYP